jgi:hypothetical protein
MDLPAAEVAEMTPRWLAAVDKKYDRASPSESCGRSSDDKKKKKKKKKEERITIANQFSFSNSSSCSRMVSSAPATHHLGPYDVPQPETLSHLQLVLFGEPDVGELDEPLEVFL